MTLQTTGSERVAPHDALAEQRVLGALLIDRDAIFKVADLLRADDFYVARHQRIYAAARGLLERRERIDPLTVQVELARQEQLDRIGGAVYLKELSELVPTATQIERHAAIVKDRAIVRRLLGAATAIAADAYDEPTDIALTLDRAEQRIFALRDESVNAQLRHIKAALDTNYDHLTERMDHPFDVSGIASGFKEIDGYTEGFTPGDLVVVAARPSVGKTSLGLAFAFNMAKRGVSTLVFSLEMDSKQIVSRFLALNSRMDLLALRTGNILDTEAASALMGLPILLDDTPGISIMELRTKARRASAQFGLGVIVVDYVQLMRTGEHEENRVQEIATITRNLKSLARELGVVVIALSQLSRAAGDMGNEPKLSTLRECVTGDTLVNLVDGRRAPISTLEGTTPAVLALDCGRVVPAVSDRVWRVGTRPVYEVRLASGRTIRATAEHRLLVFDGWRRVRDLTAGQRIATARRVPEPAAIEVWPDAHLVLLGQLIGDGSYLRAKSLRYTTSSEENSRAVATAAIDAFAARISRIAGRRTWHQLFIGGNGDRWHPMGVKRWLMELGIYGQRSYEKRIPAEVFALSNRQVGLLLRHLWATDGCILGSSSGAARRVYYSTTSEGLAKDVAALLLRFEIVGRIRCSTKAPYRPNFSVDVSGARDQLRFLDGVGAFGPRLAPAARLREVLAAITPNTNVDTVPHEAFDRVQELMRAQGVTQREMAARRGTAYGGAAHFKFAPSRTVLAEYADLLGDDRLRDAATDDIFWDTVTTIEPLGEMTVYDLTVPGPASWLADGIVSHNSGALEQDADVVIMLWRPKEETSPGAPRPVRGSIAKNRNGPTGVFDLLFEPEQARFYSPTRGQEGDIPL